jgi:hypothetical protein
MKKNQFFIFILYFICGCADDTKQAKPNEIGFDRPNPVREEMKMNKGKGYLVTVRENELFNRTQRAILWSELDKIVANANFYNNKKNANGDEISISYSKRWNNKHHFGFHWRYQMAADSFASRLAQAGFKTEIVIYTDLTDYFN